MPIIHFAGGCGSRPASSRPSAPPPPAEETLPWRLGEKRFLPLGEDQFQAVQPPLPSENRDAVDIDALLAAKPDFRVLYQPVQDGQDPHLRVEHFAWLGLPKTQALERVTLTSFQHNHLPLGSAARHLPDFFSPSSAAQLYLGFSPNAGQPPQVGFFVQEAPEGLSPASLRPRRLPDAIGRLLRPDHPLKRLATKVRQDLATSPTTSPEPALTTPACG